VADSASTGERRARRARAPLSGRWPPRQRCEQLSKESATQCPLQLDDAEGAREGHARSWLAIASRRGSPPHPVTLTRPCGTPLLASPARRSCASLSLWLRQSAGSLAGRARACFFSYLVRAHRWWAPSVRIVRHDVLRSSRVGEAPAPWRRRRRRRSDPSRTGSCGEHGAAAWRLAKTIQSNSPIC